jgi:hypothetical protein
MHLRVRQSYCNMDLLAHTAETGMFVPHLQRSYLWGSYRLLTVDSQFERWFKVFSLSHQYLQMKWNWALNNVDNSTSRAAVCRPLLAHARTCYLFIPLDYYCWGFENLLALLLSHFIIGVTKRTILLSFFRKSRRLKQVGDGFCSFVITSTVSNIDIILSSSISTL